MSSTFNSSNINGTLTTSSSQILYNKSSTYTINYNDRIYSFIFDNGSVAIQDGVHKITLPESIAKTFQEILAKEYTPISSYPNIIYRGESTPCTYKEPEDSTTGNPLGLLEQI